MFVESLQTHCKNNEHHYVEAYTYVEHLFGPFGLFNRAASLQALAVSPTYQNSPQFPVRHFHVLIIIDTVFLSFLVLLQEVLCSVSFFGFGSAICPIEQ